MNSLASQTRLITGMRMTRDEFMRTWDALPDLKRAELIEDIVYAASPVSVEHGRFDIRAGALVVAYADATPGCEPGHGGTWLMLTSAPQPDIMLRITDAYGGQSTISGNYYSGAPELAIEVSVTSRALDFGPKLALYQRAGVREYVTLEPAKRRITWRELIDGCYLEWAPGADGIYRSRVFPGLWLNADALWALDGPAIQATLIAGLASQEHQEFVETLKGAKR